MKTFAVIGAFALLASFSVEAASISGAVTLKESGAFEGDAPFKKEFGDIVKATTDWRTGDFFGDETVFAGVTIKNTGTKTMVYRYYVAFFDKDKKLLGTAAQGSFHDSGLKPGGTVQLGSCLIHLPKDRYKEIASYQAVIYESEAPPPKK
jgi:hypothetical protein